MWTDERGSEVLDSAECKRLLAVGAKQHRHGHVAAADGSVPFILPVDYSVDDSDVIIQVGEGLFSGLVDRLVAFEVDGTLARRGLQGVESVSEWSVMAQGLATEIREQNLRDHNPHPRVAEPGHRLLRIRTDVLSGRRLTGPAGSTPAPGGGSGPV